LPARKRPHAPHARALSCAPSARGSPRPVPHPRASSPTERELDHGRDVAHDRASERAHQRERPACRSRRAAEGGRALLLCALLRAVRAATVPRGGPRAGSSRGSAAVARGAWAGRAGLVRGEQRLRLQLHLRRRRLRPPRARRRASAVGRPPRRGRRAERGGQQGAERGGPARRPHLQARPALGLLLMAARQQGWARGAAPAHGRTDASGQGSGCGRAHAAPHRRGQQHCPRGWRRDPWLGWRRPRLLAPARAHWLHARGPCVLPSPVAQPRLVQPWQGGLFKHLDLLLRPSLPGPPLPTPTYPRPQVTRRAARPRTCPLPRCSARPRTALAGWSV
jgi:hypothetical protein